MANIQFFYSGDFIGETFSMWVDNIEYDLHIGPWRYNEKMGDAKDHAIYILKSEYGITICRNDITFKYDNSI